MKFASALAIYFVIWWVVLFAVLPFGVRNADEAGEVVEQGNEAGAPVAHGLGKKFLVTTVIAAVVFAGVYAALKYQVFGV
jgi:predicted secreted protein